MNTRKFKLQIMKNDSSIDSVESEHTFSDSKELLSYLNIASREGSRFYRISFGNSTLFIHDNAMTNESIVSIFEDCMGKDT